MLKNKKHKLYTSSTNSMSVTSDFSDLLFKNWFSFLSSLIDFAIWLLTKIKEKTEL